MWRREGPIERFGGTSFEEFPLFSDLLALPLRIKKTPMIIYNVTINVDESIHEPWMTWMTEKHIPRVLETGKFSKALMTRVLVEEDLGGVTYSVQYSCASRSLLEEYYRKDADRLRQESFELFGNKFGSFRTELEVIGEFTAKN